MSGPHTAAPAIGLTDDQREILEQVDRFARNELHPLQQRMDDEEWWPEHVFGQLGEQGYLGVTAPAELGGAGLDFFASGLVVQALARWNPAVALSVLAHENLCLNNILAGGARELRERYIPGMREGRLVGALGLTEPGAGSDALGGMRTKARRDGGDYVLDGTKLCLTNGVAVVMSGLDVERIGLSFLIVGMAERALDLSVEYARSREQFGRPIGEFQLVQAMLADMYAELESLRSFVYHVGAEVNALEHAAAHKHVAMRAAAVVLQAARTFTSIADKALQVHGGAGYIWETEVNRLYRAGKLWEIGAGTTEVRQLIIARELLG